jgi:integrase
MPTIKVKHVKKTVSKGITYYYDRISGERIEAEFGTPAFLAELDLKRNGRHKKEDGSLGALIRAYRASPEFKSLAPRTRADYGKVLDHLKPSENIPAKIITTKWLIALRDKTALKHGRKFTNYVKVVLSIVFNWGIPRGYCTANPAQHVPEIPRPKNARVVNRAWTDRELEIVMEASPRAVRRAIALGAYAGFREGDALVVPWTAYDGQEIEWRQGKTGEPVKLPVHKKLKAILAERKDEGLLVVLNTYGVPYTGSGFRAVFFKIVRKLVDEGKVAKGLTFHGLRHTLGKNLADAGADRDTIKAVMRHLTDAASKVYTRDADQARAAKRGMKLLQGGRGS